MSRYAVLQTSLDIPPVEALRQAFAHVPFLIAADADILARDAYGILLKNLSAADAMLVRNALATEGIETEVVAQGLLPEMPPTKFLKRLHVTDDGLNVFDAIGRSFVIPWGHCALLAAGSVRTLEPGHVRRDTVTEIDLDGRRVSRTVTSPPPPREKLFIDLIFSRGTARCTLEPDPVLLGQALGRPPGRDLMAACGELLRAITDRCPAAWLSRGAASLRDTGTAPGYPSRNAYQEEIIWLLWEMRRLQAGG